MSTQNEGFEEKVGPHVIRFDPPDIVIGYWVGDLSAEEMQALGRMYKRAPEKFYAILVVHDLGSISSAAKKAVRDLPLAAGVAIVGASRQMQLVISLLSKFQTLVNLGKSAPITFVSTEEEARRWVAHVRGAPAVA